MTGTQKNNEPSKPSGKGSAKPNPTKDAPFQIDPNDDGDMASPKPDVDEYDIKDEEDKRM